MFRYRSQNLRHFSLIATDWSDWSDWFQGSALEPTDLQALPAESSSIRVSLALRSEAEPREQCVPRQSPGTRNFTGCVSREVSNFRLLFRFVVLAIVAVFASPSNAHPFHLCVGQMKWNVDAMVWEVSLRLHPQDLETAMSTEAFKNDISKRISIDDDGFSELATKYLGANFFVRRSPMAMNKEEFKAILRSESRSETNEASGSALSTLKWVGMERERGWLWIHLEMTQPDLHIERQKLWLVHRIFLGTVERQENTIAVDPTAINKFSLQFRAGEEAQEMKPTKERTYFDVK